MPRVQEYQTIIRTGQSYPQSSHIENHPPIFPPHPPLQWQHQMPLATHLPLTTSLLTYPLLLRLQTGPTPTPLSYTTALKTISTLHSLLITTLSLCYLHNFNHNHKSKRPPQTPPTQTPYPNDTHNPTITARSPFANAIAGLEAGYLLQDTIALLLKAHIHHTHTHTHTPPSQKRTYTQTLPLPLLTHHLTLAPLLLLLQHRITHHRERGIHIIIQFLLMNASTPLLNLRWYLRTFAPNRKRAILAADISFAIAFFVARIGLVGVVLRDYGAWHGMGAWETYWRGLRVPCQVGTGALVGVNLGWWGVGVGKLVRGLWRGG